MLTGTGTYCHICQNYYCPHILSQMQNQVLIYKALSQKLHQGRSEREKKLLLLRR